MNINSMNKRFHGLLKEVGLEVPPGLANPLIENLSCDSRLINKGTLFLGLPGVNVDGGSFWKEALSSGAAAAVISKTTAKLTPPSKEDVVVVVPDPIENWIGEIASTFWGKPSERTCLIGVTGTNGKTTTTFLIEHLCKSLGKSSALLGTLVNRWPNHVDQASHTTEFADVLQEKLASAVDAGSELCALEVSSHALAQRRVAGCKFSGAIFTNLTQDHLDYHLSMESYFEAKRLLFSPPLLTNNSIKPIINIDDPWGLKLAKYLGGNCWRSSLSKKDFESNSLELCITEIKKTSQGTEGLLHSPAGNGRFISPLIGNFNLMNFLQAVGILIQHDYPLQSLLTAISEFQGVPGRMEIIKIKNSINKNKLPKVFVDYAHTPDGLRNALTSIRDLGLGQLICVFGCGGDRDREKRSKMGEIASVLADHVIITSDNPRTENPDQIINDILIGIPDKKKKYVISDRGLAIQKAIIDSNSNDVILIAGKGHEDYQIIGHKKIYFDDRKVARESLTKKSEI